MFDNPAFDHHEAVHFFSDTASGLHAIIAVHSTVLGPAMGGCRCWHYESAASALTDALRLSRGMSFKNGLAGLPLGGGKAVILRRKEAVPDPALFAAMGRAVNSLGGQYVTAEDVGTRVADMQEVARFTEYVSGLGDATRRVGGDPAPKTAYGVFLALQEAWRFDTGSKSLRGVRVAIQGIGGVGAALCRLLHEAGALLVVADASAERARRAELEFQAQVVDPNDILAADADIFAPCALGGILDAQSIERLRVRVVCGAANNQLATAQDGARLRARQVLYAPDYVVNAGGIISVALEYLRNGSESDVRTRIEQIPLTLRQVLEQALAEGVATSDVADRLAQERIEAARRVREPVANALL